MKGKTRQEKGITLIALIITIVVLLILAVVTIGAIKNDGIITYADNSATKYKDAQTKEEGILGYYEEYLGGTVGTWTQEGATLTKTNADGTKTQIKIGDYVEYFQGSYTHTPDVTKGIGLWPIGGDDSTGYTLDAEEVTTEEDLSWRVLGVNEKGQLELISANTTSQYLTLANEAGYLNAVTKDGKMGTLDAFCNDLYGKGTNKEGKKVAERARSLTVDDINKLTNYDPTTNSDYGRKVIFKYPTQEEMDSFTGISNSTMGMLSSEDGENTWSFIDYYPGGYRFRLPGEQEGIGVFNDKTITGKRELTGLNYIYIFQDEMKTSNVFTADEVEKILELMGPGENSWSWLSSESVSLCSVYTYHGPIVWTGGDFGLFVNIGDNVQQQRLFNSGDEHTYANIPVRPVITLLSDITLTGSGNDVGSVDNMWKITLK